MSLYNIVYDKRVKTKRKKNVEMCHDDGRSEIARPTNRIPCRRDGPAHGRPDSARSEYCVRTDATGLNQARSATRDRGFELGFESIFRTVVFSRHSILCYHSVTRPAPAQFGFRHGDVCKIIRRLTNPRKSTSHAPLLSNEIFVIIFTPSAFPALDLLKNCLSNLAHTNISMVQVCFTLYIYIVNAFVSHPLSCVWFRD